MMTVRTEEKKEQQIQQKPPTRLDVLEERVRQLEGQLLTIMTSLLMLQARAQNGILTTEVKHKQRAGAEHKAKPVLDTKTGKTYNSKSAVGVELGPEFGLPAESWSWYKIQAKEPERFKETAS